MLLQWTEWLGTDAALTGLPAVLPDELFATTTHLNAVGVTVYTERLAAALQAYLR